MKIKLIILLFLCSLSVFSQSDIYFLKDTEHQFSIENIENQELELLQNSFSDGSNIATYWFKIPAYQTDSNYIFRVYKNKIEILDAYQNSKKIERMPNQRNYSYTFSRKYPVYIQFKPKFHSNFNIEFSTFVKSIYKEKNTLIVNSIYYGFALIIIIYNIFYYFTFKDDSFLFYSLFLFFIAFSFFVLDGMLFFYEMNINVHNFFSIFNFIGIAYFSSRFANSYLLLDQYYPKHKKYAYGVGIIIIILSIAYWITDSFIYYRLLTVSVFLLLLTYWGFGLILFKKNIFTKILVFAYAIILFTAIDYFVLRPLGLSLGIVNATNIKIGSIIEMIIISYAIIYRMKELKIENENMHLEIINYSNEIEDLNYSNQKEAYRLDNLSSREKEIFDLIVIGMSNKLIANELNISVNTVKFHVKNIYEKLNIKSRKEAVNLKSTTVLGQ